MARHINLYSVKGGQGVSTTAVILARKFTAEGYTVLLVDRIDGDLAAILGLGDHGTDLRSASEMASLYTSNTTEIPSLGYDVIISDFGRFVDGAENYIVTLPDYVSLKRASAQDELLKKTNGAIIVRPADRVLTDRDVINVLTVPHITTIQMSAAVARASDAGLLLTRYNTEEIEFPVMLEEA